MIATTENETNQEELNLKPLLARSVVNSLGAGMVSPFTGAYAVQLGASSTDMAWFQSSANLSNNLMQIVWGRLSDRLKRRIPFIFLGTFIVATLWIPMMMVANATQLIVLLAFQALLGSMATPAWTALIGDLVPSSKLGRVNALINKWASIGGLIATLASGILMVMATGGSVQGIFFIPLVTAATLGIAASLVTLYIKEPKKALQETKERGASSILSIFGLAAKTTPFARYCTVAAIFEFFMSFSWPLFSITQIKILHADMLQIALLSVVQTIVTIAFQNWAGKIADTKGRKPLLIFFRLSLITVPVAYALSPNMETLIAISAFWGFAWATGQASVVPYLLDVTPEEHRGSFIAIYNLTIGVTTFFGSLFGGYLSDYLIGIYGLMLGLQIVYGLSLAGRTLGVALHFTLKESLKP